MQNQVYIVVHSQKTKQKKKQKNKNKTGNHYNENMGKESSNVQTEVNKAI